MERPDDLLADQPTDEGNPATGPPEPGEQPLVEETWEWDGATWRRVD
jgi:hypothetical protein